MTRWKASAIHLSLSILILGVIATVLVWRWYPPGLFEMADADKLLVLIGGVDIVLGPLLTLIVYKQGKKSLKFDLSVIALMQVAALTYGLHTVWASRPVYLVAVVDRFQLVFANEIEEKDQKLAEAYRDMPMLGAETVTAVIPQDSRGREQLIFSAVGGTDVHLMPAYYAPYSMGARKLLDSAMPVDAFASGLSEGEAMELKQAAAGTGRGNDQLVVVPVSSLRGNVTMLLDARDGDPVRPVAVDPWPVFNAKGRTSPKASPNALPAFNH
jgi:hypothetical protein